VPSTPALYDREGAATPGKWGGLPGAERHAAWTPTVTAPAMYPADFTARDEPFAVAAQWCHRRRPDATLGSERLFVGVNRSGIGGS
jgi:hypothetical protein